MLIFSFSVKDPILNLNIRRKIRNFCHLMKSSLNINDIKLIIITYICIIYFILF